jgi:hypothetical protein
VVGSTARHSQQTGVCAIRAVCATIGLLVVLNTPNRDGGFINMWIDSVVEKEFRHVDVVERVTKLVEIYNLLKHKKVPNVDTLDSFDIKHAHPCVYLSPVGIDEMPDSGLESFNAVACVLAALKVRYDGSVFII